MNAVRVPRLLLPVLLLTGCAGLQREDPLQPVLDAVPREFRAAWVATVANIDWPSKPGLSSEEQQAEARAILDRLAALRFNAVIFQVRPHADALYASELEPWSSYLSGEQGRAPEPFYDPLAYWVAEAHARGLELHAWFNPYRADHPSNRGGLAADSVARRHPDWVVALGDKGYRWMDPSLPAVREHCLAVVADVVTRYDVDGVHLDDYFYPYASYNDGEDFPDEASWQRYRARGGRLSRAAWRRRAVDQLVRSLYQRLKEIAPHVKFGISPFGIWRPGHPPGIVGMDAYEALYADAKRWWNEGWVDYLMPQLYWPIARLPQSFPVLLAWWGDENRAHRHLWPGTSLRVLSEEGGVIELLNQIQVTRALEPAAPGLCYFSMRSLAASAELGERLGTGPYAETALVPASPWLDDEAPATPELQLHEDSGTLALRWTPGTGEPAALWLLLTRRGPVWTHRVLPGSAREFRLTGSEAAAEEIALAAVDRCGNLSLAATAAVPGAGTER